ncbi:Hypothetical predicted protein [Cloeon dipterum]|uniref:C-type lectin domain-containing protein n=1 Tax=Cloeon dipterum TaxID=197152 RepID=A0A8S1CR76_9INSE|nr:Hypothetical predicted protein [Cloeon dipterum]
MASICAIILLALAIIAISLSQAKQGKKKIIKVVRINGNTGNIGPIRIYLPKKVRRQNIIKCCGFKKCMGRAKNGTNSKTTSKSYVSTLHPENNMQETTILGNEAAATESSAVENGENAATNSETTQDYQDTSGDPQEDADSTTSKETNEPSDVTNQGNNPVATTTTTTTPIPCRLPCKDFEDFLLATPTSKPSPADGSILKSAKCGNRQYYVSTAKVTRNEAGLRCKAMDMSLLTVPSIEELTCLSSLQAGTFWTSGSKGNPSCGGSFGWCSTGFNVSETLLSAPNYFAPTTKAPSVNESCLAVVNSAAAASGMTLRKCDEALPFICQFNVECPKLCDKDVSLFDPDGNLKNKTSYGIWIDIGNYTYLLGNKPMSWLSNYLRCCALGMQTLSIDNLAEQMGLKKFSLDFNTTNWKANYNYWTSGTWKGAPPNQFSWCKPSGPSVLAGDLVWEKGQPDNAGSNESCVHFRFVLNSTGTIMTDRNCANKYIFACKGPKSTTPKPCVASCPTKNCERNPDFFSDTNELKDYFQYGNWYDGCGRNILTFTTNQSSWATAWDWCCNVGLTLMSMESAGKASCYSRIVSKFTLTTFGDFWLSGTDQGCPATFRWCSLSKNFIDSELKWKAGHPKDGLDCVYLEVRNGSVLLASANCAEKKDFLCEVRKKATFQRAMQTECAEIWDISIEEIDMLLNVSEFLSPTANISLNLKCFLKCVGVEVGMFDLGALNAIATLQQIEILTQEEPVKMETAFVAYDICSGKQFDDECVTAYETFKCGQEQAPDIISQIVTNNFDNGTILSPPTPCLPYRHSCWLTNGFPCVKNQTAIDALLTLGKDDFGIVVNASDNIKRCYVRNFDSSGNINPIDAYKYCCGIGWNLIEPMTIAEVQYFNNYIGSGSVSTLIGDTVSINKTHFMWCQSRRIVPAEIVMTNQDLFCEPSYFVMYPSTGYIEKSYIPSGDIIKYKLNYGTGLNKQVSLIYSFVCQEP